MDEIKVPIYLMTGFLESGKTSFLSFTIQQDYFHTDGKTLLILCEEGEEEYDPAILEANNTVVEVIENEEDFTTDRLVAMDILHQPERVIIEYNGMWLVSNFEKMQLPTGWGVEQQITCVDGSTFQMYMANMKSIFMDMIKNTDTVIFNRCKKEDPLPTYRRGIKVANQRAEVIFEDEEGELGDIFQDEMPFDMNAPVIEILPEDYGIWFVDAMDHPENYEGKTVYPAVDTPITSDLEIHILGRFDELHEEEQPIEPPVEFVDNLEKPYGENKVLEPGVPGKMKVTRKTTLKDGLFQTHIISKTVLEEPRRELVERGMARSIETSRGRMRYNKVMTMEITAYTLGEGSGTGRTSIGLVPYEGIVAVDPRVIPYYTKLYIPGYGIAMAGDTGGAIRGNRLDVFMHDWHRAIQWGRRTLDVYILE